MNLFPQEIRITFSPRVDVAGASILPASIKEDGEKNKDAGVF